MKITAVIVTCNRLELLPRALESVSAQIRKPDHIYVVSNSSADTFSNEKEICGQFGFSLFKNQRTDNYAGALNTAIEEILKQQGISGDIFFASLDDDDIWLPDYLQELESANKADYDLIAASYLRLSGNENLLMALPIQLAVNDFLIGNPGVGGSNTFIRLKTLLCAGCFDEALDSSVDRDFFVRVFQQKPKYKTIQKHLVTAYTDKDRARLSTNKEKKIRSLKIFYYKYQDLMSDTDKEQFFNRAKRYFSIDPSDIEITYRPEKLIRNSDLEFKEKGNYEFVIGFIAGYANTAQRIAKQIIEKRISVDLVLIIEDVKKGTSLNETQKLLKDNSIRTIVVKEKDWRQNLSAGHYGKYYQQYSNINSIPLGRTILHHHLFTETTSFNNPVFWIIDDDISFRSVVSPLSSFESVDVFNIINENINKSEALIGGISNDPPVPLLSCIRSQLVDFYHSLISRGEFESDTFSQREKPDYYYDLSDLNSDHLEVPIYHSLISDKDFQKIFSGKSLSRPALQTEVKTINKTITRRGANSLVFNRELLQYYPVINLEVNKRHSRRGDLIWALLNQVVSGRTIFEHTFSLEHNRPESEFDLVKELDKAAYDITGYAFAKAVLNSIETIKEKTEPHRPKDIFENLIKTEFYNLFYETYCYFLHRRKARFIMNYYRISGLTRLIADLRKSASRFHTQLTDEKNLIDFNETLNEALKEETLKSFLKELTTAIWSYSKSITEFSEDEETYKGYLEKYFNLEKKLRKLGRGAEGVVFTDDIFVYKCFFNILDHEWNFLLTKEQCFSECDLLERIEYYETADFRFIRYPYHKFNHLEEIRLTRLISFLKHCLKNEFVYTNLKPGNLIQIDTGECKLIDYGKSIEPFSQDKFVNSVKRAFLLWKNPQMIDEDFQMITARINVGEEPREIDGWKKLWRAVNPRSKEEILDSKIVEIIEGYKPETVLDFGSGKCKTAQHIETETKARVFIYDVNEAILKSRCNGFQHFIPDDIRFDNTFDLALLNIVLCEVDNETTERILPIIVKALKQKGILVVSVCNPDFAHIHKTEFQNRLSIPVNNNKEAVVEKISNSTSVVRLDYHRPTKKYLQLFNNHGFKLINEFDTAGINLDSLEYASDFKIFTLIRE